jgi:hypothetical protein
MELLLGSYVREHGRRAGRLAGFELEPVGLRVRRIIFSADGELGPQIRSEPLDTVSVVHEDGEIELRDGVDVAPMPVVRDVILLSHATRIRRMGRDLGRVVGVSVTPEDRAIVSVFGRPRLWSRRFSVAGADVDASTPGELRVGTTGDSRVA